MTKILDHGYLQFVGSWGSDEEIIEAARMSTGKGFLGWGPKGWRCDAARRVAAPGVAPCTWSTERDGIHPPACPACDGPVVPVEGDEKLLRFLWDNAHATPFEMAGLTIEVKAPLMVFREWHRHRTQGFNEMSARYIPLPDENYTPDMDVLMARANAATSNKQAQGTGSLSAVAAAQWFEKLWEAYRTAQEAYEFGLAAGVPKELARLSVPVARYSRMRATANLRNWLGFLKLRCASGAQWEIRQYANALASIVREKFPRTYEVARESVGMP